MFPLNSNMPYIKDDGKRDKLGNVLGSGGSLPEYSSEDSGKVLTVGEEGSLEWDNAGESYIPDYENNVLIIGEHEDWEYYIPMNKRYVGPGIWGYEITTNPESSAGAAMIDLYGLIYVDGEITQKTKIKTLVHNADKNYEDDYLSITYSTNWTVTAKVPLYQQDGTAYTSPVTWSYSQTVDYVMLTEDPTA